MLPGAIATATIFLFLLGPYDAQFQNVHWSSALNRTPARACFFGALIGTAFCGLLALGGCRRFARANAACPVPFDQLHQAYDDAGKRLEGLADDRRESTIYGEAVEHRTHLARMFAEPTPVGLPWLLATGYIDAWRRLHAMEEALVCLEPVPFVVRDALADEMRLDGSSIPQNAALLKRLRTAVTTLSPSAARYLMDAVAAEPAQADAVATQRNEARAALAQVKAAIDEFRDDRREALVRARNRLFATVIFAGITGCTFLYVAILAGAPKNAILAATAFYLVGGVVGLVKQLQTAATGATAAQDDYGLGVVRLIQTPLLAGLAAIGGVVLVKLTQGTNTFTLNDTFDLETNPYGLVAAAFFGLTPALLLSSLQQRVDQYRADLSKSTAAGSAKSRDG
jgi:hypothetical protein